MPKLVGILETSCLSLPECWNYHCSPICLDPSFLKAQGHCTACLSLYGTFLLTCTSGPSVKSVPSPHKVSRDDRDPGPGLTASTAMQLFRVCLCPRLSVFMPGSTAWGAGGMGGVGTDVKEPHVLIGCQPLGFVKCFWKARPHAEHPE